MQVLIDTHILIWTLLNDKRLPKKAREIIENPENDIYYSTASIWEIGIKHQKNPTLIPYTSKEISDACLEAGILNLPICDKHIIQLDSINKLENEPVHKDPFDLLMLAQAKRSYLFFMTHDHAFEYYDENNIILV